MRRAFLLVVLLSACSSDSPDVPPSTSIPHRVPNLPRVDDADLVLAPASAPQPAAFVWISQSGRLEVGAVGPRWTGEPPADRHVVILPAEIRAEVLKAALSSDDPIRAAAKGQILGKGLQPPVDGKRVTTAAIVRIAEADSVVPVVAVAPATPAVSMARVLVRTGGLVAVKHDKEAGVLKFGCQLGADHVSSSGSWAELHLDADGIHAVALPVGSMVEIPWKASTVDRDAIKQYIAQLPTGLDVDLLIGADVDAQRFVDVVVALHAVGAQRLFVGERPAGTIEQRIAQVNDRPSLTPRPIDPLANPFDNPRPTARPNVPTVVIGQPDANGDLDKAIIRRYIRRNIQKIQYCYEKQLLASPALAGTITVEFFITPEGAVSSANASGVDRDVSSCVADVIKTIEFPKPHGGGGVRVRYPFIFRPAGP